MENNKVDVAKLKKFIPIFKQLNYNVKLIHDNYFDILGYSHYENINSNILAYYLSSENGHNFYPYFLASLFELLNIKDIDIEYSSTTREYPTEKGGRLDILIETPNGSIGIENKIFSGVNNDLEDYFNTVTKKGKKYNFLCVLSLTKEKNIRSFPNITHLDLWDKVFEKYDFEESFPNRHTVLLKEVKRNIENLSKGKQVKMPEEQKQFLLKHEKEIKQLIALKNNYEKELNQKIIRLQETIETNGLYDKKRRIGIVRLDNSKDSYILDYILYADFEIEEITLAIDIVLNKEGQWKIILLDRNGGKLSDNLTKLLNDRHINFKEITYDTMTRAQIMTSSNNESDILESIKIICEKLELTS